MPRKVKILLPSALNYYNKILLGVGHVTNHNVGHARTHEEFVILYGEYVQFVHQFVDGMLKTY